MLEKANLYEFVIDGKIAGRCEQLAQAYLSVSAASRDSLLEVTSLRR